MNFRRWLFALTLGLTLGMSASLRGESTSSDVEAVISDSVPGPLVAARRKTRKREVQQQEEEVVDLSAMDDKASSSEASAPASNLGPHGGGAVGTEPHFSVMFDLLLGYRPTKEGFSFLNFHPLLFFEIVPASNIIFSFEVNPSPRYYELDYAVSKAVTLRVGKIWVPFDDMNPHNMFGGMINTSRMQFGSTQYLPDIWADLGFGIKMLIADSKSLKLESHLYIVNGFASNGTPPATTPNFGGTAVTASDNNDNKALGGRIHAVISRIFGLGFSAYYGRWSNQGDDVNNVLILGGDVQLRFPKTELRAGISNFTVSYSRLKGFNRSGNYFEVQQKFGERDEWRLVGRFGMQDTNSLIIDDSDNTLVGGGIRWKPNFITLALEHYQDIKKVPTKTAYGFSFVRMVVQL